MNTIKKGVFIIFILWFVLTIHNPFGSETDNLYSGTKKKAKADLPVLNIYTWVDFIDPEIFSDFEKEFHVKVHVDFFDDEE